MGHRNRFLCLQDSLATLHCQSSSKYIPRRRMPPSLSDLSPHSAMQREGDHRRLCPPPAPPPPPPPPTPPPPAARPGAPRPRPAPPGGGGGGGGGGAGGRQGGAPGLR